MPETEKQQIGRYEIVEEIGRGAMGVVFKGRDPLIGREVAVKTIANGVAEGFDSRERFYREAKAAGVLQHPNIVTIYEMAESGGTPFIAMEYLEGESLEKLIARRPALPLATKVGYVVQACRALEYAHRRGVVHRDVKPANIMVTRDGVVKVVDFGIARLADTSKTQTGMLLGTLAYMSPEQVRGQQADARCDIWAMGVVLYELVAYQRPFRGENHAALLMSILQKEPPPIRQFAPECPAALERVIAKSLRKDEKERYPSMEALLKEFDHVVASLKAAGSAAVTPMAGANAGAQSAATVLLSSQPIGSGIPGGAGTTALPAVRRPGQSTLTAPEAPASRPGRTALAACAILAIIALGARAVIRRDEVLAMAAHQSWTKIISLASRGTHPQMGAPTGAANGAVGAAPGANHPPAAATSDTVPAPAPSAAPSIEDQQRYLIGLAHDAADRQDYKGALEQLDAAAELNGPLNDVIAGLRLEFSAQSHGTELERVARDEQTLWDKAMAYLNAGDFDDADESFRDILILPEGGHRSLEAARYIDQVIPERRQEEQVWAAAQLESRSQDPGHLLREINALDGVLAAGGRHAEGARQKRDAVISEMIRRAAEGNGLPAPAVSNAEQWQVTQLKNRVDDVAQRGDAAALDEIQQLQAKFKSVAEAQGPLASDARDYLNNLLPKAQRDIEDRLAVAESNSAPNAAYMKDVADYNRAVATQNAVMLRDRVLPAFRQIAQSGSVRAKEARRYADILIPAALKKAAQQDQ